jgi:hypothetical protein
VKVQRTPEPIALKNEIIVKFIDSINSQEIAVLPCRETVQE